MKRLATILLIGILFFNWYGYQLFSDYLQDLAQRRLEASLDKNEYDESQLVPLKLPVTNLAYYNNDPVFERVNGQVEIGGISYRYVKRRIFRDSLEYLCIPDQQGMRLRSDKNEFYRLVNDLTHNGQKKNAPHSFKSIVKDYCPSEISIITRTVESVSPTFQLPTKARLLTGYSLRTENPPDEAPALS